MSPGRNDPCPCGSGRKYKHCCYRTDAAEPTRGGPSLALQPAARTEALAADQWEADVLALPVEIRGSERRRPVLAMVTAGEIIVHGDASDMGATEPSDLVQRIESALASTAGLLGEWPASVAVRHAAVADLLRPKLETRGCGVTVSSPLSNLDPLARSLVGGLTGEDLWPPVSAPSTWAAWGLPEADVAALFSACAAFHRAAPWRWMDDVPPVFVEWRDGSDPWLVAVLGAAHVGAGVAVYSDPDDFDAVLEEEEPDRAHQSLHGWVLNLGYLDRGDLPRPMQREVARAGWEVAAADAYPVLLPLLTLGGGVGRDLVRRFIAVLHAVAALANEHGSRLRQGSQPFRWDGDGLVLHYEGEGSEVPPLDELPPHLREIREMLQSGRFPTSREAEEWVSERMRTYNTTPLAELSGLSPAQAAALLDGDWEGGGPLHLNEDVALGALSGSPVVTNAQVFLRAVTEAGGIPTTAAGNLRRAFVEEMLERMAWPEGYKEDTRRMNKVINEDDVWPLHVLRVVLELARLIRPRKGRFEVTRLGRRLTQAPQAGVLFALLFRTWFREFNLAYGDMGAAAHDLQGVVPLLLWRIGAEARDWMDPDALAERILPPALFDDPADPPLLSGEGPARLRRRVLQPLVRFGLLEERPLPSGDQPRRRRRVEVRVAPLFDELIRFRWDPPHQTEPG